MRNSDHQILHLAHPSPVSWTHLFLAASRELGIPLVPYAEWVDRMEKSLDGLDTEHSVELLEQSPALRILEFFEACKQYVDERDAREAMGMRRLDLKCACAVSRLLSEELAPLSAESVRLWISYWKSVGFLDS